MDKLNARLFLALRRMTSGDPRQLVNLKAKGGRMPKVTLTAVFDEAKVARATLYKDSERFSSLVAAIESHQAELAAAIETAEALDRQAVRVRRDDKIIIQEQASVIAELMQEVESLRKRLDRCATDVATTIASLPLHGGRARKGGQSDRLVHHDSIPSNP